MAIINHDLLNKLYWEEKDGKDFRLRLGWRLLFFFGINYGIYGGIDLIFHSSGLSQLEAIPATSENSDSKQLQDYYYRFNAWRYLMMRFMAMAISVLSTYWSFLLLDMRTESDFYAICFGCQNLREIFSNIKRHMTVFLTGFLLAATLVAGYYLVFYCHNTLELKYESGSIGMICVYFFGTILHSISEEIICRGYWLANLRENYGPLTSMTIMNVFFAVLHVTNPNITWRTLFSLFICGVTFTLPRSRISGLWMSTGLHTAWNFTIGNVFGDSVSGVKFKSSILRVHYHEITQDVLFGPESSLLFTLTALFACTALTNAYSRLTAKSGR